MPSYFALFSLVARRALPFGSRKLRAKPSLTRTVSPIWPSLATRSSKITSMSVTPSDVLQLSFMWFGNSLRRSGRRAHANALSKIENCVRQPEQGHRQRGPADDHDRQ